MPRGQRVNLTYGMALLIFYGDIQNEKILQMVGKGPNYIHCLGQIFFISSFTNPPTVTFYKVEKKINF